MSERIAQLERISVKTLAVHTGGPETSGLGRHLTT